MKKNMSKSYERFKAFYDVESLSRVFTVIFRDGYSNKDYLVYDGEVEIEQSDVNHLELTLVTREQAKVIMDMRQLVGFNNRDYDDYMLAEFIDGKGYAELNKLSKKIIDSRTPVWLWKDKPKDLFNLHTIDILNYINKMGISLKQLASELGLSVEEFELDFDVDIVLTKEEVIKLIAYNKNDVDATDKVFNHPSIQKWYLQHVAVIEKYLPDSAWAIYMTNAALSERALTKNKKLKVDPADKFDWTINGINVFDKIDIPEQWKNSVIEYAEKIEDGVKKYKEGLKNKEDSPRNLGVKYIKSIPNPTIDEIYITDRFRFKPGLGGAHSDYLNEKGFSATANYYDVLHSDISGAYGTLALPSRQFGEATEVYKGFMDDKNKTKYASEEIKAADFDKINVKQFINYLEKKYDVDTKGITDKSDLLTHILFEREATKLGTNDSTGKSDQPGSLLYNPVVIKQNRILLQMALYGLCVELAKNGAILLSANTDGVFYKGDKDVLIPIVKEWEKTWNFKVDSEMIDHYIGKDDNHRILIHNKKVIEVAGELRHLEFDARYPASLPRLVDVVIVEKFFLKDLGHDKSIRELIESHADDVELFAWTLKPTKDHKTAIDYKITQKVNRVLLTTEGVTIQNYSIKKDVVEKFNNLNGDNKVLIINKEIPEKLPDNIDWDAYEELINSRYKNWIA